MRGRYSHAPPPFLEKKPFLRSLRARAYWKDPVLFLVYSVELTRGTSGPVASGKLTQPSSCSCFTGHAQCCSAKAHTEHQATGAEGIGRAGGFPIVPCCILASLTSIPRTYLSHTSFISVLFLENWENVEATDNLIAPCKEFSA